MNPTTERLAQDLERLITALREQLARAATPGDERHLRHALALLSGAADDLTPLRVTVVDTRDGATSTA